MSRTKPCLAFNSDDRGVAANVLAFEDILQRSKARACLRAEATAIQTWHGTNAYTEFLEKHGRRPDPKQATAIGRLIGAQVKAADGRMYPTPSAAERKALKMLRREAANEARRALEIDRLCRAISGLAANSSTNPVELIKSLCPDLDEPQIRERLQDAVEWLTRFAMEWQRREKGRTG
jgi:hypothetical protein